MEAQDDYDGLPPPGSVADEDQWFHSTLISMLLEDFARFHGLQEFHDAAVETRAAISRRLPPFSRYLRNQILWDAMRSRAGLIAQVPSQDAAQASAGLDSLVYLLYQMTLWAEERDRSDRRKTAEALASVARLEHILHTTGKCTPHRQSPRHPEHARFCNKPRTFRCCPCAAQPDRLCAGEGFWPEKLNAFSGLMVPPA